MDRRRFGFFLGSLGLLAGLLWACRLGFPRSPAAPPTATAPPTSSVPRADATGPTPGPADRPVRRQALADFLLENLRLRARPPGEHLTRPGTPPEPAATVWDRPTGDEVAPDQPVVPAGGDTYRLDIYERPFAANTQQPYLPDLDIVETRLALDAQWVYITIVLYGLDPQDDHPQGDYGAALDLDRDGRGDVLVWVEGGVSSTDWADTRVAVYLDQDEDVGARQVCASDAPFNGTGYERLVYYEARGEDPDLAWVRWVPGEQPQVQLAFKRALLQGQTAFTWWAWADGRVRSSLAMNYHDTFPLPLAGVPYPDTPHYPVRALARLDSTCRGAYGFDPTEDDYACGVCPPEGEHPPDTGLWCPDPPADPPLPDEACEPGDEPGVWLCNPYGLPEESPIGGFGGTLADLPGTTEVRCTWDPYTCQWNCDDQCLPTPVDTAVTCSVVQPVRSLGPNTYMCGQGTPPDVGRWDLCRWQDDACTWDCACVYQPELVWDYACEGRRIGLGPMSGRAFREAFPEWSHLVPDGARIIDFVMCFIDADGDGVVFREMGPEALTLDPGDEVEVCVQGACTLNCERVREPDDACPAGPDTASLTDLCTGYLGEPRTYLGGTVVQCIIDDGDGSTLETTPGGGTTVDVGDTNLILRWDEQTCDWTCADCFYGPECEALQCPAPACPEPEDGPAFCDLRRELDDGRWLCLSLDLTNWAPPLACAWDPLQCDWNCEEFACPVPENGPSEEVLAAYDLEGWECRPMPDDPNRWECVLPASDAPSYYCVWSEQQCAWACGPAVCQPPTDPNTPGYCEQQTDGSWVCPGRGTFDQCQWDTDACRWACWDICQVDTNGPDGCDQVVPRGGNTWTCITGTKNLTCTFDENPAVCDWGCDLRCELPDGPPPACTYKYEQLGPGHWRCYDDQGNATEWRYDLPNCRWLQVE